MLSNQDAQSELLKILSDKNLNNITKQQFVSAYRTFYKNKDTSLGTYKFQDIDEAALAEQSLVNELITSETDGNFSRNSQNDSSRDVTAPTPIKLPEQGFDGLQGAEIEKEELQRCLINPFLFPLMFEPAKAVLMYGPPGTGKTELAKAAAQQINCNGIQVNLFVGGGSEFKSMWTGGTEKQIAKFFDTAQEAGITAVRQCKERSKNAGVCPALSLIFLDEIDAIAGKRDSSPGNTNNITTTNELIRRMEGIVPYPYVSILAATNRPWELDLAILRRMNSKLFVNLPNHKTRYAILESLWRKLFRQSKNVELNFEITSLLDQVSYQTGCGMSLVAKIDKELTRPEIAWYLKRGYIPNTKEFAPVLAAIDLGAPSRVDDRRPPTGYSHSDLDKMFKIARGLAAERALQRPYAMKITKTTQDGQTFELFRTTADNHGSGEGDLYELQKLNADQRSRLILSAGKNSAGDLTLEVFSEAMQRYPTTVQASEYCILLGYALFGWSPEDVHGLAAQHINKT